MTEAKSIARLPNWRGQLTAYLADVAHTPFRPGKHDCALFVSGAVLAMTGVDLARGWRGYRTLREGQKKLVDAGYSGLLDLAARSFMEVPTSFASVGDIAALPGGVMTGETLGIVQGEGVFCLCPQGMVVVDRMTAIRAFRV